MITRSRDPHDSEWYSEVFANTPQAYKDAGVMQAIMKKTGNLELFRQARRLNNITWMRHVTGLLESFQSLYTQDERREILSMGSLLTDRDLSGYGQYDDPDTRPRSPVLVRLDEYAREVRNRPDFDGRIEM
jgi:hypothetical protein